MPSEAVRRRLALGFPLQKKAEEILWDLLMIVLMADPNWNRGFYYDGVPPHNGMKLARRELICPQLTARNDPVIRRGLTKPP